MIKSLQGVPPLVFLLLATLLESAGDAVVRMALHQHAGMIRLGLFIGGAALLFAYGTLLNLAPLEFSRVIGLYIATLFVVWQCVNFIFFRTVPTLPVMVGGLLVIAGGLITTYWKPA